MKRIGQLENGRVLLECSLIEHDVLLLLSKVAEGNRLPSYFGPVGDGVDFDFQATFNAIQAWIMVKDKANALRDLAAQVDSELHVNGGEQ